MPSFHERLRISWLQSGSLLCVGIDPDLERIPQEVAAADKPYFEFGKAIVEATAPYVCAFKPQAAHFAAVGREQELAELITFAQTKYPDIPIILDAKRGDVGSTAELYAREAFERYNADAVTVNPYLGKDSLDPYFAFAERGIVVLCRTSNPGSDWLQNTPDNEPPIYLRVAKQISEWDVAEQCMLVTGATYPDELAKVRAVVGNLPLLVPGVGAQGGSIEEVLKSGLDAHGTGLVISSSRAIIFADSGPDYAEAAAAAAEAAMNHINKFR